MKSRLAVVVSHPIQHFTPLYRAVAAQGQIELKVFFCCEWGSAGYFDPGFKRTLKWDIPLTEGYDHEFLPIRRTPRKLSFFEVDNPQVMPALEAFQPDVVEVYGYARRTCWRAAAWARRRKRPVLLFGDANAKAERTVRRGLLKHAVIQSFYRRVDGAISVGDNNAAYHRLYGLPDERTFPGSLPVDRARLLAGEADSQRTRAELRESLGIPPNAFVVLFCGKLSDIKRPVDLVQAVSGPVRSGPPLWALIVGDGDKRSAVEEAIARSPLKNAVLAGFVNQSEIPRYYTASDVIAVPSSRDNHPLVVSEGAVFGLPAVVSDAVGCIGAADTARPGVNALVHPCGDVASLRAHLDALRLDRGQYELLSAGAREVGVSQSAERAGLDLALATERLSRIGPRRVHLPSPIWGLLTGRPGTP
jgi:glycosyltransferase involved in cell wall biosynthesis